MRMRWPDACPHAGGSPPPRRPALGCVRGDAARASVPLPGATLAALTGFFVLHDLELLEELRSEGVAPSAVGTGLHLKRGPGEVGRFSQVAQAAGQPGVDVERQRRSQLREPPQNAQVERHGPSEELFVELLIQDHPRLKETALRWAPGIPPALSLRGREELLAEPLAVTAVRAGDGSAEEHLHPPCVGHRYGWSRRPNLKRRTERADPYSWRRVFGVLRGRRSQGVRPAGGEAGRVRLNSPQEHWKTTEARIPARTPSQSTAPQRPQV